MKQFAQRIGLLFALAAVALIWTVLMSIGVRGTSTTNTAAVDPGSATMSAANISALGAGAHVMFVDDRNFPNITVYLAVNDSNGQPIFGLTQDQFVLREDGREVQIAEFAGAGAQDATAMLVIDVSGSMEGEKLAGAKRAANVFIDRLRPGSDRLGVLAFENDMHEIAPFGDVTEQGKHAMQLAISNLQAYGGTEFFDAVQQAMRMLEAEPGRRVVIALTDGQDNSTRDGLEPTIEQATESNVAVYTIGLGDDVDTRTLRELAERSGGVYSFSPGPDELVALYDSLASDLRNEYALTYHSLTPQLDGTRRNLEVAINTDGGGLTSEGGYAVGGILSTSVSPAIFLPLLAVFAAMLGGAYAAPNVLRRRRERTAARLAEVRPDVLAVDGPPHLLERDMPERAAIPFQVQERAIPVAASTPANVVPSTSYAPASFTPASFTPASLVRRYAVPAQETVIGSAPTAGVALPTGSVLPHHARLTRDATRAVLTDLSGGRTEVSFRGDPNQLRVIHDQNALRDGSLIRLGDLTLTYHQSALGEAWVEQRRPLTGPELTIGSAASCDLVVSGIAPLQARLRWDGERWVIDNLATGGVWVSFNGDPAQERPLTTSNMLRHGSRLRLGDQVYYFDVSNGTGPNPGSAN